MSEAQEGSSTRPYLIRALYEWCSDNGLTPYIAVQVDGSVQVPREYVKDGEIVLNISADATSQLRLGNEFIEFSARFAGVAREIMVPVNRVIAIYARENGQGMAFPAVSPPASKSPDMAASSGSDSGESARGEGDVRLVPNVTDTSGATDASTQPQDPARSPGRGKPTLTRIK